MIETRAASCQEQATDAPALSVIIPVFRAEETVSEAVASVLACPEVDEVLLVEDGSPDRSLERCRELAARYPERIRLLRHPDGGNHGAGASRNLGLRHAVGDLVAFLDADDHFFPWRFARSLPLLRARPDLIAVYEPIVVASEAGADAAFDDGTVIVPRPASCGRRLLAQLLLCRFGGMSTPGITVRRQAALAAGGFPEELVLGQDVSLWWRLATSGRIEPASNRPVARYRRYHGNRSRLDSDWHDRAAWRAAESAWRWSRARAFHWPVQRLFAAACTWQVLAVPQTSNTWRMRWLQLRRVLAQVLRHPGALSWRQFMGRLRTMAGRR